LSSTRLFGIAGASRELSRLQQGTKGQKFSRQVFFVVVSGGACGTLRVVRGNTPHLHTADRWQKFYSKFSVL
jgi:hypothetical protein